VISIYRAGFRKHWWLGSPFADEILRRETAPSIPAVTRSRGYNERPLLLSVHVLPIWYRLHKRWATKEWDRTWCGGEWSARQLEWGRD